MKRSKEEVNNLTTYGDAIQVRYIGHHVGTMFKTDDGEYVAHSALGPTKVLETKERAKLWLIKEIIAAGRRFERFFLKKIRN
jgi:hypothetical protein